MANGSGIISEKTFTWAWRLIIGVLLAILSFYGSDMHSQVYKEIPASLHKIEQRTDDLYVRKNRFEDFCRRLDSIDRKLDEMNNYLRNGHKTD